jgi:hypothetical protein
MLTEDFKEFIRLLNEHQVEYIIVGGHAVIYYGYVRYTGGLDVWINNSSDNAEKILIVLKEFGFESIDLKKRDFMKKDIIVQLGCEPDRIDIITSVEGLDFIKCYNRSVETNYDHEKIRLLSLKDLRVNKKAVGRLQDLTDLEKLKRKKKKS